MKLLLKFLSFFAIFWIWLLQTFAIDAPANLKVDSINDTNINLSWDTASGAYMYYVSYWKTSWGKYENQTDFVEKNNVTIDSLEPNNTYYFVVTALDENGDESTYSNELAEDITKSIFSLNSVNVISPTKIELVFSDPLDSTEWTERDFNIYNKSDKLDSFEVLSTDLNKDDNTKLDLTLDRELKTWIEYEVVVTAIKNSSLKNIESGIDSVETFILNKELAKTATGSNTWETATEDLNSASDKSSLIWSNIDNNELKNTTLGVASKTSKLPTTWPEDILILILSIILSALFFIFKYKKA